MIKTIIFDLDGTLVDTEPAAEKAVADAFAAWNIHVSHEDAAYVTGRTWETAFNHLFAKYPPPVSRNEAADAMLRAYRAALNTSLTRVPGGQDAVRSLSGSFPLALVSGSYRSEILFCLDELAVRDRFQVILGAEDYPRSKPAPDGFLKAMKLLNAKPEETLIFEDSTAGIASAKAAGAWVVAITGTNHFAQDTTQADDRIANLTSVNRDWVNGWKPH